MGNLYHDDKIDDDYFTPLRFHRIGHGAGKIHIPKKIVKRSQIRSKTTCNAQIAFNKRGVKCFVIEIPIDDVEYHEKVKIPQKNGFSSYEEYCEAKNVDPDNLNEDSIEEDEDVYSESGKINTDEIVNSDRPQLYDPDILKADEYGKWWAEEIRMPDILYTNSDSMMVFHEEDRDIHYFSKDDNGVFNVPMPGFDATDYHKTILRVVLVDGTNIDLLPPFIDYGDFLDYFSDPVNPVLPKIAVNVFTILDKIKELEANERKRIREEE